MQDRGIRARAGLRFPGFDPGPAWFSGKPARFHGWLRDTAEAHGISVQLEVGTGGSTDALSIYLTKGGIPSTTISPPARYIHSPVEVLDLNDIRCGVKIIVAALKKQQQLYYYS